MITLLALQVAVMLSKADELSFRDYRDCVVQHVASASLAGEDREILQSARKACADDRLAAGMELAADDVENEAAGKKLMADVSVRMNVMENELTADTLSGLVDRRMKAQ